LFPAIEFPAAVKEYIQIPLLLLAGFCSGQELDAVLTFPKKEIISDNSFNYPVE